MFLALDFSFEDSCPPDALQVHARAYTTLIPLVVTLLHPARPTPLRVSRTKPWAHDLNFLNILDSLSIVSKETRLTRPGLAKTLSNPVATPPANHSNFLSHDV